MRMLGWSRMISDAPASITSRAGGEPTKRRKSCTTCCNLQQHDGIWWANGSPHALYAQFILLHTFTSDKSSTSLLQSCKILHLMLFDWIRHSRVRALVWPVYLNSGYQHRLKSSSHQHRHNDQGRSSETYRLVSFHQVTMSHPSGWGIAGWGITVEMDIEWTVLVMQPTPRPVPILWNLRVLLAVLNFWGRFINFPSFQILYLLYRPIPSYTLWILLNLQSGKNLLRHNVQSIVHS